MVKINLDDLRVNRTLGELSATWFSLFEFVYPTFQVLRYCRFFITLIHFNYEKSYFAHLNDKTFQKLFFHLSLLKWTLTKR